MDDIIYGVNLHPQSFQILLSLFINRKYYGLALTLIDNIRIGFEVSKRASRIYFPILLTPVIVISMNDIWFS